MNTRTSKSHESPAPFCELVLDTINSPGAAYKYRYCRCSCFQRKARWGASFGPVSEANLWAYGIRTMFEKIWCCFFYFKCFASLWLKIHLNPEWESTDNSYLVIKLCLTLLWPKDYSPPISSIHGIFQARILEWVAISFSRRSCLLKDQTQVSWIGKQILYCWVTREAPWITVVDGKKDSGSQCLIS